MNFLQLAWRRFRAWWRGETPIRAMVVEELPGNLADRVVYLVRDGDEAPWRAGLRCPCGCKAVIQLSLLRDDSPSWRATIEPDGTATLYPSVWRVRDCKSHFFVRRGEIVWAKDGDPRPRQVP